MEIALKNIGVLKQAEFSLGRLTVICGDNNTGKTYATYALYGFLSFWHERYSVDVNEKEITKLLNEGILHLNVNDYLQRADSILKDCCRKYTQQLPMVFAASNKDLFRDSEFIVSLNGDTLQPAETYERRIRGAEADLFMLSKNKDSSDLTVTLLGEEKKLRVPREVVQGIIGEALKDIVFRQVFPRPIIASAERTGAAIFRKELNFARNRLLEEMSQADKKIRPLDLLFKVYQDYALPVKKNVDFMRDLESLAKKSSFIAERHADVMTDFADIIGGEYSVTKNDQLFYTPKGQRIRLSMDESSSAVRSLLDLGFYLRHVAKPGDLLLVDEPELNLHPRNQCRVARLFARLLNLGIQVFITTHSDYIIKEFNTLIMLSQNIPRLRKIADREKYRQDELLTIDKLRVFIADEALVDLGDGKRKKRRQTLIPADISAEYGIEAKSFDSTIDEMNRIQEEIVWGDTV